MASWCWTPLFEVSICNLKLFHTPFLFALPWEKEILAEIESFKDEEITVMDIDKNACRETLDFTKDNDNNRKN